MSDKRYLIKLKTPEQMKTDASVIKRVASYVSKDRWIEEQLESVREQLSMGDRDDEYSRYHGFQAHPLYPKDHELHDMYYVVNDRFLAHYGDAQGRGFDTLECVEYVIELK
jgi:hypothetical protein